MGQGLVFDKRSYAIVAVVAIALFHLAPTPVEAACGSKGVTLYQYYWCPYCAQVRRLFARYHVRYKIVEASNNPSILAKKFGDTSVPWTVVDGAAVAGFDEPRLKQLLCLK
jgi:glutaredoxin